MVTLHTLVAITELIPSTWVTNAVVVAKRDTIPVLVIERVVGKVACRDAAFLDLRIIVGRPKEGSRFNNSSIIVVVVSPPRCVQEVPTREVAMWVIGSIRS